MSDPQHPDNLEVLKQDLENMVSRLDSLDWNIKAFGMELRNNEDRLLSLSTQREEQEATITALTESLGLAQDEHTRVEGETTVVNLLNAIIHEEIASFKSEGNALNESIQELSDRIAEIENS